MFNFDHWETINTEIGSTLYQAKRIASQDEVVEQELYLSAADCTSFCVELSNYKNQLNKSEMRKIFWLLLIARTRISKDGALSSLPADGALFFADDRLEWFESIVHEKFRDVEGLKAWAIKNQESKNDITRLLLNKPIKQYDKTLREELELNKGAIKPIMCYALDNRFMPKEVYDQWEKLDKKKYIGQSHRDKGAQCGASFLLYWIKKFYKQSNGRDYFEIFTENGSDFRLQILELIKVDGFGYWYNDLIPKQGNDLSQWLKSQCWTLACNKASERSISGKNKGETSSLQQNNELVYRYVKSESDYFSAEDEEDIEISVEDLCENAFNAKGKTKCPEYLRYIWENHRKEYLQSLKALSSAEDKPEHVKGSYLGTLWGGAKDLQATIFQADWALDVNGNSTNLYIHYSVGSKIGRAYLAQGDKRYSLRTDSDYVTLEDLCEEGFTIDRDMKVCAEKKDRAHDCIIRGWSDKNPLIFSANKLKRLKNESFAYQLYILRSSVDRPRITFDNQVSEPVHGRSRKISNSLYCDLYELPESVKTQCYLSIDGKRALKLSRAPELQLLNAEDIHIYTKQGKNYSIKFVVGDTAHLQLPLGVGKMRLGSSDLAELSPIMDVTCAVTLKSDAAYYQKIKILYASSIESSSTHSRSMSIVFLPSSWKDVSADLDLDTELEYAQKGFNCFSVEISDRRQHLVTPIKRQIWMWELKQERSRETLSTYIPNAQFTAFGMRADSASLTLHLDGKKSHITIECNRYHLLDALMKGFTDIQPGDAFALYLGESCICQCHYLPKSVRYLEQGQRRGMIYAHPDRRMKSKLTIEHESEIIHDYVTQEQAIHCKSAQCTLDSDAFAWDEYYCSALPQFELGISGWLSIEIREDYKRDRREIKIGTMKVDQRLNLNSEIWAAKDENIDIDYPKLTEEINTHFKVEQAEGIKLSKLTRTFKRAAA